MSKLTLALVLVVSVFLAGCGAQGQQMSTGTSFIGGTEGLLIQWVQSSPPAEIFDAGQQTFSAGLMITNMGEATVGFDDDGQLLRGGYVELVGLEPQNLGVFSPLDLFLTFDDIQAELPPVRRASQGTIPGGIGYASFEDLQYTPDIFGVQNINLQANVCYGYTTFASGSICLSNNLLTATANNGICAINGPKQLSVSGAPLQISNLQQNVAGRNRINIQFEVANVGDGRVFAPAFGPASQGAYESNVVCTDSIGAASTQGRVYVMVDAGPQYEISCGQLGGADQGTLLLSSNPTLPTIVSCNVKYDGDASTIFQDIVDIRLDYSYFESIIAPITVRDQNAGFEEPQFR